MSDLHYTRTSAGALQSVFSRLAEQADVLVLCGDLTDYGLAEEARVLARELGAVRIPVVAVLGNHDFESGQERDVCSILSDAGVVVLDGESHEVLGIGFAGVKGFMGGFGRGTLGAWGEPAVKSFVNEAVQESLKLESALARLRTPQRIALMHYSPIRATVEGEPLEIFPYLGCGRLEEPLARYPVAAVFHGHAHNGAIEGRTAAGVAVYNVALPLLRKSQTGPIPARIVQLDATGAQRTPVPAAADRGAVYAGPERRRAAATDGNTSPAPPAGGGAGGTSGTAP